MAYTASNSEQIIPADRATKEQCTRMIEHFEQKQDTRSVNQYKNRLCEIYDFEQKFLSIEL